MMTVRFDVDVVSSKQGLEYGYVIFSLISTDIEYFDTSLEVYDINM